MEETLDLFGRPDEVILSAARGRIDGGIDFQEFVSRLALSSCDQNMGVIIDHTAARPRAPE